MRDDLHARIAQLSPGTPLDSGDIGEALAWSLLFERWPDLVPELLNDHEKAFYNQFFWFKRFATLKQKRDGYDAGLEQQVFRLLEQANFAVDWTLIEQLNTEAANTQLAT